MEINALEARWNWWIGQVEQLLGRPVPDLKHARAAFEVFDAPIKPISPREYADEIC